MSLRVNGIGKRIGLALSGGSFRAAAFHLGVMQKLQGRTLSSVRDGPRVYFNSTNLATGNTRHGGALMSGRIARYAPELATASS